MKTLFLAASSLMLALVASSEELHQLMSRALLHNTVRIEALRPDGIAIGTGFFYSFEGPDTNSFMPAVVTCWHVVSNSTLGHMHFALGSSNVLARSQDHFMVELGNFTNLWIRHPDTNVD